MRGLRGVGIQGLAHPVFSAASPGGGLISTILSYNPIAYWPLNELAGATAINYGSLGAAANGTYSGATLAQMAAPGGGLAPLFDGSNDFVNIYSAALNGGISFSQATVFVWLKAYSVATWNTTTWRSALLIDDVVAPTHKFEFIKTNEANKIKGDVVLNGGAEVGVTKTSETSAYWLLYSLTLDTSANEFKLYRNATQEGATQAILDDPNSPVLSSTNCTIGAQSTGGVVPWYGYLAHAAIYTSVLTAEQIAAIYAAGSI